MRGACSFSNRVCSALLRERPVAMVPSVTASGSDSSMA